MRQRAAALLTVLGALLLAVKARPQSSTGAATAKGSCNQTVTGSNNHGFVINCGIGQEQGKQLLDILNKVLANQQAVSPELVLHELDELIATTGKNGEQLLQTQGNLYEFLVGRLVPGNKPTPKNPCFNAEEKIGDDQVLLIYGDNGAVATKLPQVILQRGNTPVISIDRVDASELLALTLDFRDATGQIALRVDKEGMINRSNLILRRPNLSTITVLDTYGVEVFRLEYLNPTVFELSGTAVYCGKGFSVQSTFLHNACTGPAKLAEVAVAAPTCPTH